MTRRGGAAVEVITCHVRACRRRIGWGRVANHVAAAGAILAQNIPQSPQRPLVELISHRIVGEDRRVQRE